MALISSFFLLQIAHRQTELTQNAMHEAYFQFAAAARDVADAAVALDPDMTALAAVRDHRHSEAPQLTKELVGSQAGGYTFAYINRLPNPSHSARRR
jgi:hypothetical protein